MKQPNLLNTSIWMAGLTIAGAGVLATGCAEQPVAYVPVYQAQPAYAAQPVYTPAPPPPASSGIAAAPTSDWQQPAQPIAPGPIPAQPLPPPPAAVPTQPPPQTVVVAGAAPPPAPVEVIPVAPGAAYVWMPGYYAWNGRWIWVGGRYVVRPRPGVVWVGGHWAPHRHGYVWIGGTWR